MLWTRLAPDLSARRRHAGSRLQVAWRVATDPACAAWCAGASPRAARARALRPREVGGLEPGREYFYRFKYRDELSPIGRTKTAPRTGPVRALAFAFASCQAWDDGYYSAYRRMAEEDLAFVVHLGDYLYEYGIAENGGVRNVPCRTSSAPSAKTLERYRLQYALYKSDPDLQRAHRCSRG